MDPTSSSRLKGGVFIYCDPSRNLLPPYGPQQQRPPPPAPLPASSQAHPQPSTESLQRRLAESEAARASLVESNASLLEERQKKDARFAQFLSERKKGREEEDELNTAVASDHARETSALREELEDLGEELEEAKQETRGLTKRVDQLDKKLSLKARENENLRGELASEARRYEGLLQGKALELEKALEAGRGMERELEEVRTREGGEKELKEALEAKDREIGSLVSEKKSLTSALKELESERTKQMDQFSAFSASFQSFNKRPLPLDASSSSSSSSQPPAKKFKEIDPIYTNGMPSTEAEKTVFVDYWTNKLIPKKAEGRMCVLCKNAAGARPREPLHFASDVLKSEPLMSKALVAHLVPLHAEHWDRICSGIGKK